MTKIVDGWAGEMAEVQTVGRTDGRTDGPEGTSSYRDVSKILGDDAIKAAVIVDEDGIAYNRRILSSFIFKAVCEHRFQTSYVATNTIHHNSLD